MLCVECVEDDGVDPEIAAADGVAVVEAGVVLGGHRFAIPATVDNAGQQPVQVEEAVEDLRLHAEAGAVAVFRRQEEGEVAAGDRPLALLHELPQQQHREEGVRLAGDPACGCSSFD